MSRIRLLLLGVLGALAVSAVASSSALAVGPTAKCEKLGTLETFVQGCIETLTAGELLVLGLPALETILLLSKKEPATANSLLGSNGLKIECTEAENEGLVDGSPSGSVLIEQILIVFTGCTVPEPANCALSNGTIRTELLAGAVLSVASEEADIDFTTETALFAEFEVVNSGGTCNVAALLVVLGEVLCILLTAELDETLHTLDCEKAPGLTFAGGVTTEFTLFEDTFLDTPPTWSSSVWNANPPWSLMATETIS